MPLTRIKSLGITDGTIVNADINASAAIDASKLTGLSSDFVKLASTSASGATTINVDGYFTSDYDLYFVRFLGFTATVDGQDIHFAFRRSNAEVTASNYDFRVGRLYGMSSIDQSGNSDAAPYRVWYGTTSASNQTTNAEMWIYNPLATTYPTMSYVANSYASGSGFQLFGSATLKSTGAISGFTLKNATMSCTDISIYGVKS